MKTLAGNKLGSDLCVVLALVLLTLLIRLPFFFPAVINWDESSSIIMGQTILDGSLPYAELWNVKPPLLYYFFAAIIGVFGATIEGVRTGGALCVAIAGISIFFYSRAVWNNAIGIVAAVLAVFLISGHSGSQSTMSEHLALVPFMLSLVVLRRGELTYGRAALMGLLLSAAGLIRLNLAFVAVAFMLLVFFHAPLRGGRNRFALLAIIGLTGLAGVAATALPHLANGSLERWWSAVFAAPMSYASSQHGIVGAMLLQVYYFANTGYMLGYVVFLATLVFFNKYAFGKEGVEGAPSPTQRLILLTYFGATVASVLFSGGAYQHYLIQISPFMAIFAAAILVPAFRGLKTQKGRRIVTALASAVLVIALIPALTSYKNLFAQSSKRGTVHFSPEYAIADYLRQHSTKQDGIYMMTDHIVYWFLGKTPIDQAVTHPSNIAKEYLLKHMRGEAMTTDAALGDLFDSKKPLYVVKTEELSYMKKNPDALAVIDDELAKAYVLETTIEGRQIYRRKN